MKLQVLFEFLCAFVPPRPFADAPDKTWVVLPNLKNLADASRRHFPVLLFDHRDRVSLNASEENDPNRRSDSTYDQLKDPFEPTPFELCDLGGEDIMIRPSWSSGATSADKDFRSETATLQNLMRIKKAGLGLERFDGRLLEGEQAVRIAARLELDQGRLFADPEAVTNEDFEIFNEDIQEVVAGSTQKIARRIVLEFDPIDSVDFAFRKFGESATQEKTLRLKSPAPTGTITVRIRNTEGGKIWRRQLPGYSKEHPSEMNLYFPYSANQLTGPLPHMLLRIPSDVGDTGICAPKAFDGWTIPGADGP